MAVTPSILNTAGSGSVDTALSLLDAARSTSSKYNIGLSANARALTESVLEQQSGTANALFSTGVADPTDPTSQQNTQLQILALRAQVPKSHLSLQLQDAADAASGDSGGDTGGVSPSTTGQNVNTTA